MSSDEELTALVTVARDAIREPGLTPARAWWVHRPDADEPAYALVEIGPPDAVGAVVAVDAETRLAMSSARLAGNGAHLTIDAETALALAGFADGRARLVWAPSRQSASPLYPLWEVRPTGVESVAPRFVDLSGQVWPELEASGPGG